MSDGRGNRVCHQGISCLKSSCRVLLRNNSGPSAIAAVGPFQGGELLYWPRALERWAVCPPSFSLPKMVPLLYIQYIASNWIKLVLFFARGSLVLVLDKAARLSKSVRVQVWSSQTIPLVSPPTPSAFAQIHNARERAHLFELAGDPRVSGSAASGAFPFIPVLADLFRTVLIATLVE